MQSKKFTYKTLFIIAGILFFVVLLLSRNSLNDFVSSKIKEQNSASDSVLVAGEIEKKYNYFSNNKNFDFTLIEFGSTGCTVCKQMEPVLEEISNLETPKMNVVFLNIMHPENLPMMKYFGISAVPMQILLDKKGKEFFRHYGFIDSAGILKIVEFN